MALRDKLNYYQERIRLGSFAIKPEDIPFQTFLIGYFAGQSNCSIDDLYQVFDIMAELADEKMLSQLGRKQIYNLIQDYPERLKDMIKGLFEYKSGSRSDLIGWIQSFYHQKKDPASKFRVAVHQPPLERTGTLELDNSQHSEELMEGSQFASSNRMQEEDMEMARKLQQEMDKQNVKGGEEEQVLCQICYCGLYDEAFEGLDDCGHFFHINCMSESFKTNILSNQFPLRCPNVDCLKEVTEGDIKRVLQDKLFQKYQSHTLKAYAQGHGESISWCPTANCTNMFFFEKDDPERFECDQCKKQYCLNCRVDWHKDMTCKQYKVSATMSEDDKKFFEFAKGKKFKQCPKCKFWVEKSDGCDHMTCKCTFQFCYKCGGVYMKCECMEEFRKAQERRRAELEERRRLKAERKKDASKRAAERAERAQAKNRKNEEKLRRAEELRRQRDDRQARSSRRKK